jgi:hypothetical protein
MPLNTAFEMEQKAGETKKDLTEGCLKCPKCNNSWFEEVKAQQYVDDHTVILGQGVPPKNGAMFILLRCTKCSDLVEPRVLRQARDAANQMYDNFIDSLKGDIKSDKI